MTSRSVAAICLVLLAACATIPGRDGFSSGAETVTIVRDRFGVPHVYGPTDASVVFGLGYAQAEDEVWLVEEGFLRGLGRVSEVRGEETWRDDVAARALELPRLAREEYERSPAPMRALYDAYAAGLNHYLARHPEVELRALERFEPWHTLAFVRHKYFVDEFLGYAGVRWEELDAEAWKGTEEDSRSASLAPRPPWREPENGSNAWAIAPTKSATGNAMLFMNPHVGFFGAGLYYESHLVSEEGWNLSGTGRYGFPFPYIAHNEHLGWSHTDNYPDHGDLYLETFDQPDDPLAYRYGDDYRQAVEWQETIRVRTDQGLEDRVVRLRKTHHGPILLARAGKPVAVRLANLEAGGWYEQHYAMGKARTLAQFREALSRNSINYMNVVYADRDGNVYYVYNGIVPIRATEFDWDEPVDGSDPRTEWRGFHELDELPQVLNPECGYVISANSTPFTSSATDTPDPDRFPDYMIGPEVDNARAQVSREIIEETERFDFDGWARAALDTRVHSAGAWIGALQADYRELRRQDPERAERLGPFVGELSEWDGVARLDSTAMTLFVLAWEEHERGRSRLEALEVAVERLRADWGSASVPWGELNRMQRRHWSREEPFDDEAPSVGVPGGPGRMGMAFVYHARPVEGQRRRYGTHGNSFVSVVELGETVRARSILFFGASGDPTSPHYFDQAPIYGRAELKPAWFEPDEVRANAERTYEPVE